MRKTKLTILLLIIIPVILFAVKKPDWVTTGKSSKYPQNLYLIGIGIAPEQKNAEDRARAEIAKIFESKVQSVSEDYQKSESLYVKRGIEVKSEESFSQKTRISTDKVLEGVIITEVFNDKKNFYALAILDKVKTQKIILSKIHSIDDDINSLLKEIEKESILLRVKRTKKSIDKLVERDLLNKELSIVGDSGLPIPSDYTISSLSINLENMLTRELKICVDIKENGKDGELRALLIESINKAKFFAEKERKDCHISVEGSITIEPFNHPNKSWKWAKYEIDIKFVDLAHNKVIGSKNLGGEKSHLEYDAARQKAKNAIKEKMLNEINGEIIKSLLE